MIPYEEWSRDHWSVLGYAASLLDRFPPAPNTVALNRANMRCDDSLHPLLSNGMGGGRYGTRTKSGEVFNHDDYSCIDDLEDHGLVSVISLVNGFVRFTDLGLIVANELRLHKAEKKNFASFVPSKRSQAQMVAARIGNTEEVA